MYTIISWISEKKFSGVNYHVVGKKPEAPEAKISFSKQSAIDASFKQRSPKNQEDERKTIRDGQQNLKDQWPLA